MVVHSASELSRGDIVKISFDPTLGHEQSGFRPALIVSDNQFHSATGFALCLPITSKKKGFLFEIDIQGEYVSGVALVHGARMLDMNSRSFSVVDKATEEQIKKAQIILSKIIEN